MQELMAWANTYMAPYFSWMQIVLIIALPTFLLSFGLEWLRERYRSGSWQAAEKGQRFYWKEVDYGTPRQLKSYNWFVLNLHEFVDMWRDALAAGPVWQRLRHFVMPPDWQRRGHTPIHTWTVERKDHENREHAAQPQTLGAK